MTGTLRRDPFREFCLNKESLEVRHPELRPESWGDIDWSYHKLPEKAMAPHSSTLAWKIPWTEEPGRLQSMGLRRVGHD